MFNFFCIVQLVQQFETERQKINKFSLDVKWFLLLNGKHFFRKTMFNFVNRDGHVQLSFRSFNVCEQPI